MSRNDSADLKEIKNNILHDAKVVKIEEKTADIISERALLVLKKWLEKHESYTSADISRVTSKELKKYNKELAFLYHNRDKII